MEFNQLCPSTIAISILNNQHPLIVAEQIDESLQMALESPNKDFIINNESLPQYFSIKVLERLREANQQLVSSWVRKKWGIA